MIVGDRPTSERQCSPYRDKIAHLPRGSLLAYFKIDHVPNSSAFDSTTDRIRFNAPYPSQGLASGIVRTKLPRSADIKQPWPCGHVPQRRERQVRIRCPRSDLQDVYRGSVTPDFLTLSALRFQEGQQVGVN